MNKEANGMSATIKIIVFVLAVLGSAITIYTVFHVPLVNALAEEKSSRQIEDAKIKETFIEAVQEQQKTNGETNVVLAKILVELSYIKEKVKTR